MISKIMVPNMSFSVSNQEKEKKLGNGSQISGIDFENHQQVSGEPLLNEIGKIPTAPEKVTGLPWLTSDFILRSISKQGSNLGHPNRLGQSIHNQSQEIPKIIGVKLKSCSFFRVRKERYGLIKRPPIREKEACEKKKPEEKVIVAIKKFEPPPQLPPQVVQENPPSPISVDSPESEPVNKDIIGVVRDMIEHAKLPSQQFLNLSDKDKCFIFCVISIFDNETFLKLDMPPDQLITTINEKLQTHVTQHKRKDDRLRWFYKRFIRFLLRKHTEYRPTKQYKAQDFNSIIAEIYFGSEEKPPENLCNTTFASKKRLLTLFRTSKLFAQAAAAFIRNELMDEHHNETNTLYIRMYKIFEQGYYPNVEIKSLMTKFSKDEYLRLPWRNCEVVETVKFLHSILRLALNIT